ncbi:unnamed protein product [Ranitomeya imitator]|uniref:Malic enzyme NAD-binding domain-containing protein n=1 Tax=Ranitomeya imitator TaxID=111125 RepID=A0ABN9MQV7_9NEOB|nr:unnamed protein product [Ranitomeya imitator]
MLSFCTKVIAKEVSDKHLEEGRLYPPLQTIQEVSVKIAVKIVENAYKDNTASVFPEPEDKETFVRSQMYTTDYDQFVVDSYSWPEEAMKVQTVTI